jgi:hypothetical protein
MSLVSTVLGLIGVMIFIPTIIGLAAGLSWLVVKFSPGTKDAKEKAKAAG